MSIALRTLRFARGSAAPLACDRRGATAIEYALIASMMVIALVGLMSVGGVADSQNATYGKLADSMKQE